MFQDFESLPSEEIELMLVNRSAHLTQEEREAAELELERRGIGPSEDFDYDDSDFEGLDELKAQFSHFTTLSPELEFLNSDPPGWYDPLN